MTYYLLRLEIRLLGLFRLFFDHMIAYISKSRDQNNPKIQSLNKAVREAVAGVGKNNSIWKMFQ